MPMKHTLLAICCIGALVGFPMVTMAEDTALPDETIQNDPASGGVGDAFSDRAITVEIDDELQSGDENPSKQNSSDGSPGDDSQSDADVGICVVGAGGPCN